MKETFHELVEMLKKNRVKCPWVKELDINRMSNELISEIQEVREAIDKKDYENLKEEIGDVFMDTIHLALLCEEKGHFKAEEIIKSAIDKLIRRKPWVFGDEKINTSEEALKRWNEIKKQEKGG